MFKARIYGDFAVKFRAFGFDLGYAKKSIDLLGAVVFEIPVAFPAAIPLKFDKYGIKINAILEMV